MGDVLVVDDDVDVSWMLEQVLLRAGHTVRVAHDGEEGFRLLDKRAPNVLVLDIEMPVLDGPGMAYRMFIHDCGLEDIPIVLVSGIIDIESIARRVGTPYFLPKPFDSEKLLILVRRAMIERNLPRPPPPAAGK